MRNLTETSRIPGTDDKLLIQHLIGEHHVILYSGFFLFLANMISLG